MKILGILVASLLVSQAYAKPVYLECFVLTHKSSKVNFTVMLDETSSSVTHVSKGQQFKTTGFFSPTKIIYKQENNNAGMIMLNEFEIDRTDLNVVQTFVLSASKPEFSSQFPPTSTVQKGSCKIADTSNQKI